MGGHVEAMKLLIARGAAVDAAEQVLEACMPSSVSSCKSDARPHLHGCVQWGRTPLHEATDKGNVEAMKLLIDSGAAVDTADMVFETCMFSSELYVHWSLCSSHAWSHVQTCRPWFLWPCTPLPHTHALLA